jgi:hypothetical protein
MVIMVNQSCCEHACLDQQSAREPQIGLGRNVEVMWLAGRVVPDPKTIVDFRKDNGRVIRQRWDAAIFSDEIFPRSHRVDGAVSLGEPGPAGEKGTDRVIRRGTEDVPERS